MPCFKCSLCQSRKNIVWGEGNINAPIFIIGEAPGYKEDKAGIPFIGESGQYLNYTLGRLGLTRNTHLFVTNVVKCRPVANRNPYWSEILACRPYLERQLRVVKPKIVLLLGAVATQTFFNDPYLSINKMRGQWKRVGNYDVIATYHPAAILYKGELASKFYNDLWKMVHRYMQYNIFHEIPN